MKEPGIYKITCAVTGKIYVGSAVNLYRRWYARHLPALRKNKHHNRYLQAAWNKYGENAFTYEAIEKCAKAELIAREQYWIDSLCAVDRRYGYNIAPVAGSTLGVPQSQKSKDAVSTAKSKPFIVCDPAGNEMRITNLFRFCADRDLTSTAMNKVAKGKKRHHKGWECRPADVSREEWAKQVAHLPATRPQKIKNDQVWCSKCREYRPPGEFNRNSQSPAGLAPYCRNCSRHKLKMYYRARRAN